LTTVELLFQSSEVQLVLPLSTLQQPLEVNPELLLVLVCERSDVCELVDKDEKQHWYGHWLSLIVRVERDPTLIESVSSGISAKHHSLTTIAIDDSLGKGITRLIGKTSTVTLF
jgi:hypothetical protein